MNLVIPVEDIYKCSVQTEVALINDYIHTQVSNFITRIEGYIAHVKDNKPINLAETLESEKLDEDTINAIINEINARLDEGVSPAEIFIAELDSADLLSLTAAKRFHLTLAALLGSLENDGLKFKIAYTAYGITLYEA